MLEAIPHRPVQQMARVDALEHDGQLKVAERHVGADPGNLPSGAPQRPARPTRVSPRPASENAAPPGPPPIQSASRDALGIPGGAPVTVMIYRIAERTERKILTPHP